MNWPPCLDIGHICRHSKCNTLTWKIDTVLICSWFSVIRPQYLHVPLDFGADHVFCQSSSKQRSEPLWMGSKGKAWKNQNTWTVLLCLAHENQICIFVHAHAQATSMQMWWSSYLSTLCLSTYWSSGMSCIADSNHCAGHKNRNRIPADVNPRSGNSDDFDHICTSPQSDDAFWYDPPSCMQSPCWWLSLLFLPGSRNWTCWETSVLRRRWWYWIESHDGCKTTQRPNNVKQLRKSSIWSLSLSPVWISKKCPCDKHDLASLAMRCLPFSKGHAWKSTWNTCCKSDHHKNLVTKALSPSDHDQAQTHLMWIDMKQAGVP